MSFTKVETGREFFTEVKIRHKSILNSENLLDQCTTTGTDGFFSKTGREFFTIVDTGKEFFREVETCRQFFREVETCRQFFTEAKKGGGCFTEVEAGQEFITEVEAG